MTRTTQKEAIGRFFIPIFYALLLIGGKNSASAFVSPDLPPNSLSHEVISRLSTEALFRNHLDGVGSMTENHLFSLLSEEDRSIFSNYGASDFTWLENYLPEQETSINVGGSIGLFGTNSTKLPLLQMGAETNPLLDSEQGRFLRGGMTLWGEPRVSGKVGGWLAFDAIPLVPLTISHEDDDLHFDPSLYIGYIKFGWKSFETTFGRFALDWGHGESGSLILGGAGDPLTGIRIQNSNPVMMPWIFKYLGPTQFVFVVSRFSDQQTFPHTVMVAERVAIRPTWWLELGFSQAIMLGGDGAPDLSFGEAVMEVLGRRTGDVNNQNNSNRNFLGDFKVTIPQLSNLALYSDIYFEDCCGTNWARDVSNLIGVFLPAKAGDTPLLIRWEWVRTTEITFRNETFTTGFADRGKILGHPIGPDADAIYLSVKHPIAENFWLTDRFGWEWRARNQLDQKGNNIRIHYPGFENSEERFRFEVDPTLTLEKNTWLKGRLAYEYVNNFSFVQDNAKHQFLGSIEVGANF